MYPPVLNDAFSALWAELGEAIRERVLRRPLARKGTDWTLVERLLADNLLLERKWQGERFFRRNLEKIRLIGR